MNKPPIPWKLAAMPLRVAAPIIYGVAGCVWILGGDLLLSTWPGGSSVTLILLGSAKEILFVAISSIALYALLRRVDRVDRIRPAAPIMTILILLTTAVLVVAGGYHLFRANAELAMERSRGELTAVAEAQALRLKERFAEHLGVMKLVADSVYLDQEIEAWRAQPDETRAADILNRVASLQELHEGEVLAVSVVDGDGTVLLATGDASLAGADAGLVKSALHAGRVMFGAPYRGSGAPGLGLVSAAAPIGDQTPAAANAAIVAVFDLRRGLAELDATAGESYRNVEAAELAYVDGNDVWWLTAAAAEGWRRIEQGGGSAAGTWSSSQLAAADGRVLDRIVDRHGAETLATVRRIAGTGFYFIAQLDKAGVQRESLGAARLGLGILALTGLAVVIGVFWVRRRAQQEAREQVAEAEHKLGMLAEHFELANRYANDVILLVGPSGRILQANDRAVEVYGYTRGELLGLKATALQPAGANEEGPTIRRFGDTGTLALIFETVHRRKNGSTFPVEVSARRFKVGERTYSQSIVRDITKRKEDELERKRIEAERDRMAERIRAQFYGNPLPCSIVDADFRMTDVNPAFERLFGWKKEELVGQDNLTKLVAPDAVVLTRRQIQSAVNKPGPRITTHENVTRDGRILTCRWTDTALRDATGKFIGIHSVCEDLSDELALQKDVAEREAALKALAESALIGVFQLNQAGEVTYINDTLAQMFGVNLDVIAGQRPKGLYLQPEDRPRAGRLLRDALDGKQTTAQEFNYTNSSGQQHWVLIQARPVLDGDGKVLRVVGTTTDITSLKNQEFELERRVAERTEEYRVAKERAERADAVKMDFLATMSHELRTPLNSIVGFTEVLLEKKVGPLNDQQERQLSIVRDAARRQRSLISDLLDISRIETGRLEIQRQPVAIDALVSGAVRAFELEARGKGLDLRTAVAEGIGNIETDGARVEQIVSNLLSNAIKYTASGSVSVRVGRVDGEVLISVTDTGVGIAQEDRERIFEPFVQLRDKMRGPRHGVGLGLAISRRLAIALGGSIAVESVPGVGSTFRLRLPARQTTAG